MAEGRLEAISTWEEALFHSLYRVIQALRIHQDNNQLVKMCLTDFQAMVSRLNFLEPVAVEVSEGRFYVQGEKIQYRKEVIRLINSMLHFFQRRGLAGLRLYSTVQQASLDDLLSFMRLLVRSAEQEDPAGWLLSKSKDDRFPWVTLLRGTKVKRESVGDLRAKAKSTYFHAMSSVKEVAQRISSQGYAGVRKSKRMVQSMLDCLAEDEALFLGLSTIKDYDDYTYAHSVNVAILSLCLGNRIGLSRRSLEHLGICGLFHDLGKVEVPREILTKPGRLTDNEWTEMRKHPMASVRQILKLRASHEVKSKILLAPFEHHVKFDLSGYPQTEFKRHVSLFGRILQIADVYDAITSPRAYRPYAMSPDQAMNHMIEGAGKDFDPTLLKVFGVMMGTYPVGSLLELDTGELGVVVGYPAETEGKDPRLILLEREAGGKLLRGKLASLSDKAAETGAHRRNILRSLNPALYGIQPASFIL